MNRQLPFFVFSPDPKKGEPEPGHVLLHVSRPLWAVVNQSGLSIAKDLARGHSLDRIAGRLSARYGISHARALSDAEQVRQHLLSIGLLNLNAPAPLPMAIHSAYLHLTRACNLSCSHCYRKEDNSPMHMKSEHVQKLADGLSGGPGRMTFSGGEPLLHPEFEMLLDYASQRLRIRVCTNGTLMDRGRARLLAKSGARVQVSLDGADAASHDAVRGQGAFDQTMDGLEALAGQDMMDRVDLSAAVTAANINTMEQLVALARQWGAAGVRFMPLADMGRAGQNWDQLNRGLTLTDHEKLFTLARQWATKPGVKISCGLTGFVFHLHPSLGDNWCPAGREVSVETDGSAYPCALLGQSEYYLGNLFEQGPAGLSGTLAMKEFQQNLAQRMERIDSCKGCTWRGLCRGGCMGQARIQKGTVEKVDRFCAYRKRAYREAFTRLARMG